MNPRVCPECEARTEHEVCPVCGTRTLLGVSSEPEHDPLVGKVLENRYRLEAMIGKGGMGAVYQATQIAMNKTVAVKLIKPELASHVEAAKRFHREAKASSLLSNPHSIRVFDFGQTDDRALFMVMEYLDGQTLTALQRRVGRLPMARAAKIGAEISQSLVEAHARGLIHRDLKPENVLLLALAGDPDFVKVLDFGIAKFMTGSSGDSTVTHTGAVIGTPHYMAPEQAKAVRHMTTAADVYALGVMLYEMLTGTVPFDGETPLEILMAHVTNPVPDLPPDLPVSNDMRALLRRMLAKSPGDRPAADEVQRALEAIRQRESAMAYLARASETGETPPDRAAAPYSSPAPETPGLDAAPTASRKAPAPAQDPSDEWPDGLADSSRANRPLIAGVAMLVVAALLAAFWLSRQASEQPVTATAQVAATPASSPVTTSSEPAGAGIVEGAARGGVTPLEPVQPEGKPEPPGEPAPAPAPKEPDEPPAAASSAGSAAARAPARDPAPPRPRASGPSTGTPSGDFDAPF